MESNHSAEWKRNRNGFFELENFLELVSYRIIVVLSCVLSDVSCIQEDKYFKSMELQEWEPEYYVSRRFTFELNWNQNKTCPRAESLSWVECMRTQRKYIHRTEYLSMLIIFFTVFVSFIDSFTYSLL